MQQMAMIDFASMPGGIAPGRARAKGKLGGRFGLCRGPRDGYHRGMTRDEINAFCATLPGSEHSDPWGGGHDCWKVGGKMYAVMGTMSDGVSVKCADVEFAEMLIESGRAVKAPYFYRSWVRIEPGAMEAGELRDRIRISYDLIRAKLPKKLRDALPAPA